MYFNNKTNKIPAADLIVADNMGKIYTDFVKNGLELFILSEIRKIA